LLYHHRSRASTRVHARSRDVHPLAIASRRENPKTTRRDPSRAIERARRVAPRASRARGRVDIDDAQLR